MVIQSVASDNRTVTLTQPLKYEHLGVTETFDGTDVEFRAEVGMVSRNIIVKGDSNPDFVEKIEACPDGFDTGTVYLAFGILLGFDLYEHYLIKLFFFNINIHSFLV